MVQFLTGSKIKRVFADLVTIHKTRIKPDKAVETFKGKEKKSSAGKEVQIKTEDAGSVLIQFENGARGVFTVSQVSAGRKNHFWLEVAGSIKAFSWNQENPNELWIGYRDKANEVLIKDPSLLSEEARKYASYPGGHPEGYPDGPKNLFASFYNFIREGKNLKKDKSDFPTFEDGHIENKIVDAILKSNKTKRWIDV
jgi:predicted dehydrogenase